MYVRDYEKDKEALRKIILGPSYTDKLIKIAHREEVTFKIDLNEVEKEDSELCDAIINNTKRYVKICCSIVDEILPDFRTGPVQNKDTFDVFIEHRLHAEQRRRQETGNGLAINEANFVSKYPPELMRRYELVFEPLTLHKPIPVRQVKAKHVGKFVTVSGIVTRVQEVKPRVLVATYTCDSCAAETYQPIESDSFMPLERCQSEECKANRMTGRLYQQIRGSKFVKFQKLRIQEHSRDVPVGNIPRSLEVCCRGEMTRLALPGDHVHISGIFLPSPHHSGPRNMMGGLLCDTYLEAHRITITNKSDEEEDDEMTDEEFVEYIQRENININRLANSIAPEIYGHLDLKKALLLLLVGGVDRNTNGMKIRGAINICLMGDPGVAKSQLLGFIGMSLLYLSTFRCLIYVHFVYPRPHCTSKSVHHWSRLFWRWFNCCCPERSYYWGVYSRGRCFSSR